jgi:hypothetical protein
MSILGKVLVVDDDPISCELIPGSRVPASPPECREKEAFRVIASPRTSRLPPRGLFFLTTLARER